MLQLITTEHHALLSTVGLLFLLYLTVNVVLHLSRALLSFWLSRSLGLSVNPCTLGAWAVVTGATDGIGKAYASALAKRGMNIVLVSRSVEKLQTTSKEIEALGQVKTKCIPVDFSGGVEIYDGIERQLEGLDIGVLVNNVGMSYDYPEFFHQVADREHTFNSLLHINIFPVTFLTAMLLPNMVEKKKGAIINIGSAACVGCPLLSVYSATKSYVDSLSRNLQQEYASKGIIIQSVTPHHVATKMSKIRNSSFSTPSPSVYAESALATLGLESATTGYPSHWLASTFVNCLPEWMKMKLIMTMMMGVRAKALKKMAAKKE